MRRKGTALSATSLFHTAPSGSPVNDLFGALECKGFFGFNKHILKELPGKSFFKAGSGLGFRLLPAAVELVRIGLQGAVSLHPLPCGAGGHGETLKLGIAKPRLDLHIGASFGRGQPFLPVQSPGGASPDKEFPPFQTVGGALAKSPAVAVEGGFKFPFTVGDLKEMVLADGVIFGVAAIVSVR